MKLPRQTGSGRHVVPAPSGNGAAVTGRPPAKARSVWRRAARVLLPGLLILCAAEGVLRLAGVGYPTAFFIDRDGRTVETNERFAWRFMSRELARDPLAFRMARRKLPGTVRIVILGESAAQGFPDPAFGFGRLLETLLRARYPDRRFEVVNTAMTAVNSHAVREIARECLRYEPDLFLLYCGNNEVVGPFGPGTVFQSGTPPLWLIRVRLGLLRSRTVQALNRLAERLAPGHDAARPWHGMETFLDRRVAADDPRLERVYAHFRGNARDIIQGAGRRGVPLVLCTVPVNLETCAPFASEHRRGLTGPEEGRWRAAYALGTNAEARADWVEAERRYADAAALDAGYAEVDFRRARCLAALGRQDESRKAFSAARDHDALRFRADARLNAVLRDLAQNGGPGVRLYDAEAEFAGGRDELFHEHVHLTFSGNYRLARGFLPHVEAALSLGKSAAAVAPPPLTEEECAVRLACTPWSRWQGEKKIMGLLHRPPFTLQFDWPTVFPARQARFRERATAALSAEEKTRSTAACEEALKAQPDGLGLRENLVELLTQCGDYERALREARTLLAQWPGWTRAKVRVGDVFLLAGRFGEAESVFREVLRTRPEMPEVHASLVGALVGQGRDDEALDAFRQAMARGYDTAALRSNAAVVLLKRGDLARAEEHLRHALRWTDEPVWHANLGAVLYRRRNYAEALSEFQAAVSAMPQDAALRYNLSRAQLAVGHTNEAISELRQALQIAPNYGKARRDLEALQALQPGN